MPVQNVGGQSSAAPTFWMAAAVSPPPPPPLLQSPRYRPPPLAEVTFKAKPPPQSPQTPNFCLPPMAEVTFKAPPPPQSLVSAPAAPPSRPSQAAPPGEPPSSSPVKPRGFKPPPPGYGPPLQAPVGVKAPPAMSDASAPAAPPLQSPAKVKAPPMMQSRLDASAPAGPPLQGPVRVKPPPPNVFAPAAPPLPQPAPLPEEQPSSWAPVAAEVQPLPARKAPPTVQAAAPASEPSPSTPLVFSMQTPPVPQVFAMQTPPAPPPPLCREEQPSSRAAPAAAAPGFPSPVGSGVPAGSEAWGWQGQQKWGSSAGAWGGEQQVRAPNSGTPGISAQSTRVMFPADDRICSVPAHDLMENLLSNGPVPGLERGCDTRKNLTWTLAGYSVQSRGWHSATLVRCEYGASTSRQADRVLDALRVLPAHVTAASSEVLVIVEAWRQLLTIVGQSRIPQPVAVCHGWACNRALVKIEQNYSDWVWYRGDDLNVDQIVGDFLFSVTRVLQAFGIVVAEDVPVAALSKSIRDRNVDVINRHYGRDRLLESTWSEGEAFANTSEDIIFLCACSAVPSASSESDRR